MVLTLSDSPSQGHMLGRAPRSRKRGDWALGGRQHRTPSFSPLPQPQLSQRPEGHTAEAAFPHQPPIPHRQEAGKASQPGILGAAIHPQRTGRKCQILYPGTDNEVNSGQAGDGAYEPGCRLPYGRRFWSCPA